MINESKNIKNESINQITRDNVLALDIAEHCGYYSTHESGTWNFTQRKGKNAIEQHKMFYDTLVEFIQKYNIKLISPKMYAFQSISLQRENYPNLEAYYI